VVEGWFIPCPKIETWGILQANEVVFQDKSVNTHDNGLVSMKRVLAFGIWAVVAAILCMPNLLMFAQSAGSGQKSVDDLSSSFRCPEDYPSAAAKMAALNEFIREYTARFPNKTVRDLLMYRYHLLVLHSCVHTLRYMLAHVSPTAEMIRFDGKDYGPKTEGFDPTNKVWTIFFKEDGKLSQPDEELIFNFYGWNPPTSPSSIASAWLDRGDNVHTIWKFEAPDDLTKSPAYFFVSATTYPGQLFGYVNITKITSAGPNGAYAVTFSKKITGRDASQFDKNVRAWILSEEGKTASKAIGYVGVDSSWERYLAGQPKN
jgi:hypothetical protein